jgi:two-component system nitrogen regulation response regulator NtrX
VLIAGPPGAGKELTARVIHAWSQRASGSFIILPAASMAPDRMEEELFGTVDPQGGRLRVGALEEAHGGTLYIDEVADMPIETQGKVLRVLVDQTFQRVGGSKRVKVDVRILSSTSKDLENQIKQGAFREDLYHRLAVVPVRVPALAERREDIPELIEHFAKLYSIQSGQAQRHFAEDAVAVLQTQDWPGNVRQLRNNIERVMIMSAGDAQQEITAAILAADANANISAGLAGLGSEQLMALSLREAREIFERDYLAAQLSRFGGNISKTSSFVGMERSALHRKIKLLGLSEGNRAEEH